MAHPRPGTGRADYRRRHAVIAACEDVRVEAARNDSPVFPGIGGRGVFGADAGGQLLRVGF